MKCFNHEERDAVATCQKCGKGLCKECASKHTPCLCDMCFTAIQAEQQQRAQTAENQRRQKYVNALVDTRSEFIKTCVLGIICGVIAALLINNTNEGGDVIISGFLYFFFVPFGWKLLTYIQSKFPVTVFGTFLFWIIWCVFKIVISIFVGVPAFIYQLFKTISAEKKMRGMKRKDDSQIPSK